MVIITKFLQVSLATLSVSYLILRLEISSLPPSLTFLGWDSSDDDDDDDDGNEMDNHEDQPILLCSGKSLVIFVLILLYFHPGWAGGQGLLQPGLLARYQVIHSIISHPVIFDTAIRSSVIRHYQSEQTLPIDSTLVILVGDCLCHDKYRHHRYHCHHQDSECRTLPGPQRPFATLERHPCHRC